MTKRKEPHIFIKMGPTVLNGKRKRNLIEGMYLVAKEDSVMECNNTDFNFNHIIDYKKQSDYRKNYILIDNYRKWLGLPLWCQIPILRCWMVFFINLKHKL
jgi:hypothetical protein